MAMATEIMVPARTGPGGRRVRRRWCRSCPTGVAHPCAGSVHLLDGQALSSQEPRESDAIGAGALDTEGDNCAFCADMLAAEAQQSGGGRPRRPPVGGAVAMCGREWLDTAAGITVETNAGSARGHNGSHRVGAVFAPVSAIR